MGGFSGKRAKASSRVFAKPITTQGDDARRSLTASKFASNILSTVSTCREPVAVSTKAAYQPKKVSIVMAKLILSRNDLKPECREKPFNEIHCLYDVQDYMDILLTLCAVVEFRDGDQVMLFKDVHGESGKCV